jgi:hypothetical protein
MTAKTLQRGSAGNMLVLGIIFLLVMVAATAVGGIPLGFNAVSPTPTPTPIAQSSSLLTWAPPQLTDPTTILVTNSNRSLKLDKTKDYIIQMPKAPLTAVGGLVINGGHNVVLIGGEISIESVGTNDLDTRGLYVEKWTGTMHIEGLWITGAQLTEGIDVDTREHGSILQLENIRVDKVVGSQAGHHADVVQTWGGPDFLRIDHLTGSTGYQGFFLDPSKFAGWNPTQFVLKNVNIDGRSGAYILYQVGTYPITATDNVWVDPDPARTWPSQELMGSNWTGVQRGVPPTGDFVPLGVAGLTYTSPGYSVK